MFVFSVGQLLLSSFEWVKSYLEMLHVYNIEPDNGREQPYIRLSSILSIIIWPFILAQMFLYSIQRFEELGNSFLVCFLCGGETGSIHTIVDVIVCPFICSFDLFLQIRREEIDILVFRSNYIIKLYRPLALIAHTMRLMRERQYPDLPRYKTS